MSPASIRRALLTALAVGLLAAFLAPPPAHAQQVDESYVDLSVEVAAAHSWAFTARNNGTAAAYGVTIDIELGDQAIAIQSGAERVHAAFEQKSGTTCSGEIPGTTCLSGVFSIGALEPGETKRVWIIPKLASGLSCCTGPTQYWSVPARAVIKNTVPVELERYKGDNTDTGWIYANGENSHGDSDEATANYELETSVDDLLPEAGDTVMFSLKASMRYNHDRESLYGVKLRLKLSPGFGTPTATTSASGTSFTAATGLTRTWDWDIGTFQSNRPLELEVSTTLDDPLPDGVARSDLCLTAELTARPDNNRNGVQSVEICLGEDPVILLREGEIDLFTLHSCVGVDTYPCSSADGLKLALNDKTAAGQVGITRSDAVILPAVGKVVVNVQDPGGRRVDGSTVSWRTAVNSEEGGVIVRENFDLTEDAGGWTAFSDKITAADIDGNAKPGTLSLYIDDGSVEIANADTGDFGDPYDADSTYTGVVYLDFGSLGTYATERTYRATHNNGTATTTDDMQYTTTGSYVFHVGPVADLEVGDGDGGLAPAGTRAFTIVAVNNGPDDAPDARVTVTGLNAGDYVSHTATAGSFATSTGVWTIGELRQPGYYRSVYGRDRDGEVLTIITSAALDSEITAAISNYQDYQVCIDSGGDDVATTTSAACTAEDATNTWHTAKYFDHISANGTTTIRAKAGTGAGLPAIRSVEAVGPAAVKITWGAVTDVNGRRVTHYEVERETNPWTPVADVTGTRYVDTDVRAGQSPRYRVRAVNDRGHKGPWSQPSGQRPGAPGNFSATVAAGNTRIDLSWGAPAAAAGVTVSGYDVEYLADGATWTSLAAEQSALTYAHTGLALSPGDVRQYRARTVGTVSGVKTKSDWTATSATVPGPATPGVPKSFAASGSSDTRAALSWGAPDTVSGVSVTGYELDFSKDGGNTWNWLPAGATRTVLSASTLSHPHTDTTLAADAVRQYRLRTVGSVGGVTVRSGYTYAVATRDYPTPGAPRDFTALAVNRSQVNLSWSEPEAVSGVRLTGYHLEFSTDGNAWNRLPAAMAVLATTTTRHEHVDAALSAGAIRQYRVRAVGADSNNAVFESGWVFASAATEEVGAPRNLTATRDGIGRIDLTWDEPAFGTSTITGYRIDTLASPEQWRTLAHSRGSRRYEHTGLSPGQEYCYRVAAVYAGGTGPFSAHTCATTEGAPANLPGKPENLRIAQVGSNYVTLEWDAPSAGGAVEYYEWRSNVHGPAEVSPRTATSVTVRGLAPGSSYEFQVRAGNGYGPGGWSRHILVTLNRASSVVVVKASPAELEVKKGGSGSFNVRLNRSPQWPLALYTHSIGPECLTNQLAYQQGKIMLPDNLRPSKEFWEDGWWGPPDDRWAQSWRNGVDIQIDASGCQGGETTVVEYSLYAVPFSYLEGQPMWEELDLNEEEWREKWGIDPLDGISGPSVKVTVVDPDP